jgi:hypothetical protein
MPQQIASFLKKVQAVFDLILLMAQHEIALNDEERYRILERRLFTVLAFQPDARYGLPVGHLQNFPAELLGNCQD